MNEPDPLAGHIRHLLDDATCDAPTPPAMPFDTVPASEPLMHQRRGRPLWIVASAAALLIGVVAGLAALTDRDGTSRSNVEEPPATATAPASTPTWCSVLPALTPSQIEATIRADITGAGTCTDGFAGTLTLSNSSGDTCTSDIMANLAPTGGRLWFASTSRYGGATGRWEPLPDDLVEGAGVMEYPTGVRSWPIQLPPLEPGTYSLTLGSGITCTTSARFEATFEISAAPDAPPPSESCDTAPLASGQPTPNEATPWTLVGCDVSEEVLLDRPGPAQCAWDSARVIVIGWPIGTPTRQSMFLISNTYAIPSTCSNSERSTSNSTTSPTVSSTRATDNRTRSCGSTPSTPVRSTSSTTRRSSAGHSPSRHCAPNRCYPGRRSPA